MKPKMISIDNDTLERAEGICTVFGYTDFSLMVRNLIYAAPVVIHPSVFLTLSFCNGKKQHTSPKLIVVDDTSIETGQRLMKEYGIPSFSALVRLLVLIFSTQIKHHNNDGDDDWFSLVNSLRIKPSGWKRTVKKETDK